MFQTATYPKAADGSALRVVLSISTQSQRDSGESCTRWYFTFNGAECSSPATIDYLQYSQKNVRQFAIPADRTSSFVKYYDIQVIFSMPKIMIDQRPRHHQILNNNKQFKLNSK